jgi:hypothetical protein
MGMLGGSAVHSKPTAGRGVSLPGSYGAMYLLQPLTEPVELLGRMWAAVRPKGVLIVEEADLDGWCCHPANEGIRLLRA